MAEILQIVISGFIVGSIYALIALGFSLVYRVTNVINLAQGGFCILGALGTYSLQVTFGWPPVAAAVTAIVAVTAAGVAVGAAAFVPGLSRLSHPNMLMLTAGLLTLFEGLALLVWGSQPYELPSFSSQSFSAFGIRISSQGLWIVGTAVVIIVLLWYLLARTKLGKALRACAENPAAASLMGVSVARMQLSSFGLAAAIGAIAGVVIAPATSLQFDTGRLFTIQGFIAVAI